MNDIPGKLATVWTITTLGPGSPRAGELLVAARLGRVGPSAYFDEALRKEAQHRADLKDEMDRLAARIRRAQWTPTRGGSQ